jgi:hypothetical protein
VGVGREPGPGRNPKVQVEALGRCANGTAGAQEALGPAQAGRWLDVDGHRWYDPGPTSGTQQQPGGSLDRPSVTTNRPSGILVGPDQLDNIVIVQTAILEPIPYVSPIAR